MNKELQKIYQEDQGDRKSNDFNRNPLFFIKRDRARRKKISKILKKIKFNQGQDYYYAAMIFHHSPYKKDIKMAIELAEKSFKAGYKKARWLYAAAIDRLLVLENKKQKFGTQFFQKNQASKVILFPIDPSTTDKDRLEYNVPSFKKIKQQIAELNKKVTKK